MLNPDFRDMLSALNGASAEYLVVGAYALAAHGIPRATGDLDLWVRPTPDNAARVRPALESFGAPLGEIHQADLIRSDTVIQLGVAPRRIDLLTSIDGVEFDEAWSGRIEITIDDLRVPVIGRAHLIRNKRAVGRPQDLADVSRLEE